MLYYHIKAKQNPNVWNKIMSRYTKCDRVFKLTPSLTKEQVKYLSAFSRERHCLRNEEYLSQNLPNEKVRAEVGLPVGKDGMYCVYGSQFVNFSEHMSDEAVIDLNRKARECPELYCSWLSTEDGNYLYWIDGEMSRCVEDWLIFIESHFFSVWGIKMKESNEKIKV